MIQTVKNCYCDIVSEHNGENVAGATRYENVDVMVINENKIKDSDPEYIIEQRTIDLCPACRKKFSTNLFLTYDSRGQIIYTLGSVSTESAPTS